MFKSASTIRSEALARVLGVRSDFSVLDGEPQTDLVDTLSIEISKVFFFADYVQRLTSIQGLLSIVNDTSYKATLAAALGLSSTTLTIGVTLGVPSDLANDAEAILYLDINRIANDYGLARKAAEYATGVERFYTAGLAPVTIPIGTKIYTRGTTGVSFSTTTPISAVVPTPDPSGTGYYYVDVAIQCDSPGTVGNTLADTIQTLATTISGVVRVTNIGATVGGAIRESNLDLLNRILAARSAIAIDTRQGYVSWATSLTGILAAYAAGPGDALMVRAPAGAVDLWIQGTAPQAATVTTKVLTGGERFVLPYQPVLSVPQVVGSSVYTEGNGYTVVYDTAGGYAGSTRANTYIQFDVPPGGGVGPAVGEVLTVSFVYDGKVKALQDMLDTDPVLNVPAADVLVKAATRWFCITEMHVVPLPGYTGAQAESAVATALNTFFSAKRLGQGVDWSDVLVAAAAATLAGSQVVDRIDDLVMGRDLESSPFPLPPLTDNNLAASNNEYYALGEILFV